MQGIHVGNRLFKIPGFSYFIPGEKTGYIFENNEKGSDGIMTNSSYWFYLEQETYTSICNDCALLYNTLTGFLLEVNGVSSIINLLKKTLSPKNGGIVNITQEEFKLHPEIETFINQVVSNFSGELIECKLSKGRPFQMSPIVNIHNDIEKIKKDSYRSGGENIKRYLNELNLYLNGQLKEGASVFTEAFKQFLTLKNVPGNTKSELDFEKLKKFLFEAEGSKLNRINIVGGNICEYSKFEKLLLFLNHNPAKKIYHMDYLDISNPKIDVFNKIDRSTSELVFHVHFPYNIEKLSKLKIYTTQLHSPFKFFLIVQNENEFKKFQPISEKLKLNEVVVFPYYNGKNFQFFKDNVFLDKNAIIDSKPTMREIIFRKKLNPLNFGKLTVFENGDIHANPIHPKIGRLGDTSLSEVLFKELSSKKSWMRTRDSVNPCKGCNYSALCTPLSNYEYAIGQNNLCHISDKALF
jgi:pseudo-rSAM protein